MTQLEIFQQVDARLKRIKELVDPTTFVLNKEAIKLKKEIKDYQKVCKHRYVDGICKYCYKPKKGGNED